MSFATAIQRAFSQYATFRGRARRSEYWWFVLFQILVLVAAVIADGAMGFGLEQTGPVEAVVTFALLLPSLAVTARRLHDTGRSGWWMLISLVPLVGLVMMLVFTTEDSHTDNAFGPTPKRPTGPGYGGPGNYAADGQPAGHGAAVPALVPDPVTTEDAARSVAERVYGSGPGTARLAAHRVHPHGWYFVSQSGSVSGFGVAVAENGHVRGFNVGSEAPEGVLAELSAR